MSKQTELAQFGDTVTVSSGNVGIGTSPSHPLHVKTSTDGSGLSGDDKFIALFQNAEATDGRSYGVKIMAGSTTDQALTITDHDGSNDLLALQGDGKLGIGTSSPTRDLVVSNSSQANIALQTTASGSTLTDGFQIQADGSHAYLWNYENTNILLGTNNTERMRLDASGNFMVGTTVNQFSLTSGGDAGMVYRANASLDVARDDGTVMFINRLTSNGDLVEFRKNGGGVGSIGTDGSSLYIGSFTGSDSFINFESQAITPSNSSGGSRDNAIDLGKSDARFDDIYATNGTIQTSDRNEKQDIAELTEAEQRVAVAAKGLLRKFRWKSAVAEKGEAARTHFGIIAQDLQAAFEAEGLDAGKYGMFISSTWTDEETGEERTRLGVRYSELLAFIIGAL